MRQETASTIFTEPFTQDTLKTPLLLGFLFILLASVEHAQNVAYYVSPTGSDSNPGTLDAPLATPKKAEALVLANYLGVHCSGQTQPVIVQFLSGTWFNTSLTMGRVDSGCGPSLPVIFEAYPGSTPEFSAGIRVTNWTTQDNVTWQATLPTSTVNFENLYYNGQRRYRPRLTSSGNLLGDQYRIAGNVAGKYDRFIYSTTTPISDTWKNYSPSAGNQCGQTPGPAAIQGDIEIVDFEKWDTSVQRVSCIDTVNHIVYLTGSTTKNTLHGYLPNHRFVVENVQDELSIPGQWFLDRSQTPWVLNYIANPGENPNNDTVVIPQAGKVFSATGLSNRSFLGLTFCCDNFVVGSTGYFGSQAEYAVPPAFFCDDCSYVTVDSNTFTNIGGYGMAFMTDNLGTATGDVIQNNLLYDLGAGGIMTGRLVTGAETDANAFQFSTIQNNLVQGYGRRFAGAAGIANLFGHDITTTHNDVNDGYSQGIMLCYPATTNTCAGTNNSNGAFNVTTSYNHIWNLGQGLLSDFGGVYLATYNATGDSILGNKIHDISDASVQDSDGYGGNGIYIDRGGPISVSNNLVYRVSNSTNMTIGPPSPGQIISFHNNIFAYARLATFSMHECPAPGLEQFTSSNNIVFVDRTPKSVPAFGIQYLSTYLGTPVGSVQSYSSNDYWNTGENLLIDPRAFNSQSSTCTAKTYDTFANWQALGEDMGSMVANPNFVSPAYPNDNYAFAKGVPKMGFTMFCTSGQGSSCAGRTSGVTIPTVNPGYATDPFNPATDY
jgi:hypothetical protein